jgi:hypothetical protein
VRVCESCRVGTSELRPLLQRHGDTAQVGRVLAGALDRRVPCRPQSRRQSLHYGIARQCGHCETVWTQPLWHCATVTIVPPSERWAQGTLPVQPAMPTSSPETQPPVERNLAGFASSDSVWTLTLSVPGAREAHADAHARLETTVEAAATALRHCATATTQAATSYTPELLTPVACAGVARARGATQSAGRAPPVATYGRIAHKAPHVRARAHAGKAPASASLIYFTISSAI